MIYESNEKSGRARLAMLAAISIATGLLGACGKAPEAKQASVANVLAPSGAGQKPVASYQELMKYVVDPTADDVWNAVSTTVTKHGVEEHRPKTDEEWETIRRHAITLIEASNLLVIEGRPVVIGKATTSDSPDEWGPAEIGKAFVDKRAQFLSNAQLFRESSQKVLAAIDARNVPALVQAGSELDQACESCHVQFWYPNQKLPKTL